MTKRLQNLKKPPQISEYHRTQGESIWDVCQKFIDTGYVLHGSPSKIELLEPRPVEDASKGFGTDTAVFAVRSPASAIFSAIIDRRVLPENADRRVKMYHIREIDDYGNERVETYYAISKALKNARAIKGGWVHVLPKDTFIDDPGSSECKSYQPVRPKVVIPVKPEDFPFEMHILPEEKPKK
ncbi:MAG: hypothetical protein FJ044_03320 [Candidatus Cloacimonetes bacterium]|nr:hypothetical protein [Candidatus Cloacimonadota bacterium]